MSKKKEQKENKKVEASSPIPESEIAEIEIVVPENAPVVLAPDGSQYIATMFLHKDGTKGYFVIGKMQEEKWVPDIKSVIMKYNEDKASGE